ncbi:hypothetical protein ABEW00_21660 [Rossellomorea vietnamensis]|uniref:hypothetical protein n=1 Tax=Rossellomorea vietnamensis TaxID=218284 RepID=UPI003D2DAAB0
MKKHDLIEMEKTAPATTLNPSTMSVIAHTLHLPKLETLNMEICRLNRLNTSLYVTGPSI